MSNIGAFVSKSAIARLISVVSRVILYVVGVTTLALISRETIIGAHAAGAAPPARLVGVNLSGAELNSGKPDARPNFDYIYPSTEEFDWATRHGMTVIRLPVDWSRLQPKLNAPLNRQEVDRILAVIRLADARHLRIVLDLHNYGFWHTREVGSRDLPNQVFADSWRRIAKALTPGEPGLILGLMNEPHTMSARNWEASAQAALNAIRAAGTRNLILVSGTSWDGAHSWTEGGTQSNATAMNGLRKSGSAPVAFEFHQYFDNDSSGMHRDCVAPAEGVRRLASATSWLEATHQQGLLGEFATSDTPACLRTLEAVLSFIDAHQDAWIGWTWWAAGPWWGDYMFSLEPKNGVEKPQMTILLRHLH